MKYTRVALQKVSDVICTKICRNTSFPSEFGSSNNEKCSILPPNNWLPNSKAYLLHSVGSRNARAKHKIVTKCRHFIFWCGYTNGSIVELENLV